MTTAVRSGSGQSQEPRIPLRSNNSDRTQLLLPSFAVFPGILAGSWMGRQRQASIPGTPEWSMSVPSFSTMLAVYFANYNEDLLIKLSYHYGIHLNES